MQDVDRLVSILRLLHSEPELVRDAGQRARQAFLENYDLPIGTARICAILENHREIPVRQPAIAAEEPLEIQSTTSASGAH